MSKNNNKKPGMIYERIAKIMEDMPAIGKDQKMQGAAGGYNFRSIDQVYDVLHKLLAKHRVFFTPHVTESKRDILDRFDRKDGHKVGHTVLTWLNVKYVFHCAEDGSSMEVGPFPGEAMDSGDKSSSKAMSLAMKGALLQVFCIPIVPEAEFADDEPAGDVDEVLTGKAKAKQPPKTQRERQSISFGELAQELSDRDCNGWKLCVDEVDLIFQRARNLSGATEIPEVAAWLGAFGQLKLITNDVGDVTGIAVIVRPLEETPA